MREKYCPHLEINTINKLNETSINQMKPHNQIKKLFVKPKQINK